MMHSKALLLELREPKEGSALLEWAGWQRTLAIQSPRCVQSVVWRRAVGPSREAAALGY